MDEFDAAARAANRELDRARAATSLAVAVPAILVGAALVVAGVLAGQVALVFAGPAVVLTPTLVGAVFVRRADRHFTVMRRLVEGEP